MKVRYTLFREFLAWCVEGDKKFLLIANKNCVTYKEVFPLIKSNKLWSGRTEWSGGMWFISKHENIIDKIVDNIPMKNVPSTWFTNLDHGRRHTPLDLMTMADNLKFSRHKGVRDKGYQRYDNYEAIEVPYTDAIPSDYEGVMGVPISFLEKYCPEQFEILGTSDNGAVEDALKLSHWKKHHEPFIDGKKIYKRLFIKYIQNK